LFRTLGLSGSCAYREQVKQGKRVEAGGASCPRKEVEGSWYEKCQMGRAEGPLTPPARGVNQNLANFVTLSCVPSKTAGIQGQGVRAEGSYRRRPGTDQARPVKKDSHARAWGAEGFAPREPAQ